jgi:hypothetical protein
MIKNKKAQIMVLDILFSVVLIVLISFLMVNIVESKVYQSTTDNLNSQLNNVGEIAFKSIINNPQVNCYAYDSKNKYHIPGCLANASPLFKNYLGIPSNYKCSLTGNPSFTSNECNDVFDPLNKNYYSVDFNVSIISSLQTSKLNYLNSIYNNNNAFATKQQLNLKVWRE